MAQYANNLLPVALTTTLGNAQTQVLTVPGAVISANDQAAILSFFQQVTGNDIAATALTSSIIYTSTLQGIDPIAMIQQFKTMTTAQLNQYLSQVININRVPTSLLGVQNQPQTGKYVQRAILP